MLIIAVCYEHGAIRTSTGYEEQTYRGISPSIVPSTVLHKISKHQRFTISKIKKVKFSPSKFQG